MEKVIENGKLFDLKVGDIITAFDTILDGNHKFVVTGIYPHIFTGKRLDNGQERAFRRTDYRRGALQRKKGVKNL